ncbi:YrvL family regulatory protein [Brochothrix thermosphacta]|uniref:YrvL family regulatory protein n=1 Tax=Brochothrix thermosphacta TaxID=2756 RepID=UPI000EDD92C3|nr:YrvL family regulatory protein [Brochothrix thermosphacta]HCZ38372.1 hypothetical protein [Brochothrix thermosphacta]HCZ46837.1 hypothetical protein [Brochothrix thermosphacta]
MRRLAGKVVVTIIIVLFLLVLLAIITGTFIGVLSFVGITYNSMGSLFLFFGVIILVDSAIYLPARIIRRHVPTQFLFAVYILENLIALFVADLWMSSVSLTIGALLGASVIFGLLEYALYDNER